MKLRVKRFKARDRDKVGLLLENLRYAGLVYDIKSEPHPTKPYVYHSFTINPPKGINEKVWAEQNIARMRSFSILAERERH